MDEVKKSAQKKFRENNETLIVANNRIKDLEQEISKLLLMNDEEQRSSDLLKNSVEERDQKITELELKLDGIATDFAYLKECESKLNKLTQENLERNNKRELETQALENQQTESKLIEAQIRINSIRQVESELQNKINQQTALLSNVNSKLIQKDELLRKQKETIEDQAKTMENLRLKNIEHMTAVREKYETIKNINTHLETRIVELKAKLEDHIPTESSSSEEDAFIDEFSTTPVQIKRHGFE
ncbi:hypothetical protein HK096_007792 [Nowakowskiella sp. JEL0078]|nr:hypothetical protein HK096_007792 [Nowakowskiella sp. JEL0078]